MTLYGLKFKLEIMNMILQMIKNIKKCHERTRKSSPTFLATKRPVTNENNSLDVAMKSYTHKLRYTLPSLIFFACGVIVIKPNKTILILASLNPSTWNFKFFRD